MFRRCRKTEGHLILHGSVCCWPFRPPAVINHRKQAEALPQEKPKDNEQFYYRARCWSHGAEKQRKTKKRPERWERVSELFEVGDLPNLSPSHTLWGAYNAVTRYEDYRQAKEAGSGQRLNRVWFGQGADLKLHALQKAGEFQQVWLN